MRPTDENQAGSTRPNLMSSRRAVGEDNILAMLERDSARRSGSRISTLRLVWYGAAAAFAGILAGGVAWLAYDNHKTAEQLQAGHDVLVAVPPVVADAGAPPQPAAPALPAPAAEAPRAAVIVDEPAPAPRTASSALPPLVMLPRHEAVAARAPAQSAPRASRETAGATPATPARPRSGQAAAGGRGDKKADKAQRSAARAEKRAPQRSATRTAADTARQRKAASAPPQVDSDVALISAIIAQSERHRGEREAAAACEGAKCPPKPAQP